MYVDTPSYLELCEAQHSPGIERRKGEEETMPRGLNEKEHWMTIL